MISAALLSVLLVPARAQVDDSDLAGRPSPAQKSRLQAEWIFRGKTLVFPLKSLPSARGVAPQPGFASGTLLLADPKGALKPARLANVTLLGPGDKPAGSSAVADDGTFSLALPDNAAGEFRVRASLDNQRWAFQNPDHGQRYAFDSAPFTLPAAAGVGLGALGPAAGSESAKVGWLHLAFLDALDALARLHVETGWWDRTLDVNWPDSGDYFSPWNFSLHLTKPEAWDVVLHELGHAVMHLSMRAASAGGAHKIDECYSPALAWSEGWATFFAGVVHLDPADPDARFEFLVPRRAPIRLENVPADVCRGQANEWRVAAALWDLYDGHADGLDTSVLPFARLWQAWAGKTMGSLTDYFGLLAPTLSPSEAQDARGALTQSGIEGTGPFGAAFSAPATLPSPRF